MPTLVSELAGAAFLLRYIGTCNEQVALDVGKLTLKSRRSTVPCSLLQQKYVQNDSELLAALHCKV